MANMYALIYTDGCDHCCVDYTHPLTLCFDPRHWGHKFNGPSLRYLVSTGLVTGLLCYISDLYHPAQNPEQVIANKPGEICDRLEFEDELSFGDGIYATLNRFITHDGTNSAEQLLLKVAEARHETVNHRFKEFAIMSVRFRNKRNFHKVVHKAVANLVQLSLMYDRPLWSLEYSIRRYGGAEEEH